MRSLARQVGKAPTTVRKWIYRDNWPFSLSGPWDVERVKIWAEIQAKADPEAAYRKKARAAEAGLGEFAPLGPLTKARIQATIERALLIRQRRLVEAGRLHDVEECGNRRLQQIHAVRTRLMELPQSLAQSLAGQSSETIESVMKGRIEAVLEEFSADENARREEPEE